MAWYRWWLDQQLENVPDAFSSLLPDGENIVQFQEASPLTKIFLEVAELARSEAGSSIDSIIDHLVDLELVKKPDNVSGTLQTCRTLVFAILGWQTMLYTPSFGTSPPKQFAICDDLDGFRGQTFLVLRQDQLCAKRRLSSLLMGFGLLLPPPNTCLSEDPEERQAFESTTVIQSGELNAFLLQSIAHIQIKWIDVLAPHLEFNKATNTLYLFRYPSFCVANIPSETDGSNFKGVIHSCAAEPEEALQWASESDVCGLLHEILCSYRLLFGQNKEARKLFRRTRPFEDMPSEAHDPLLTLLCSRKSFDSFEVGKPQGSYRVARDFPMLRCRLAILKRQLSVLKPRGWMELWRDKRDSAHWFTFWAVIIIGGAGLLLSFIQVILQIVQVSQSVNGNH
ncbi:hypothetical protein MMC16_004876 [Acarospora aff. strigata]|nr:hypothetical protein [Acarospora aff. strigata]